MKEPKIKEYVLMEKGVIVSVLIATFIVGILIGCGIALWTMMIRGLM